jgi:H+/Cl- antiporter ClcA
MGALGAPIAARARTVVAGAGRSLATAPYLRKWLVLGGCIGTIAGLGATTFYELLRLATALLLHDLAGVTVPLPAGEGLSAAASGGRTWALPLVLVLGGLVSGFLVFRFAPEAEGHGTDAAIHTVHENPRGIRARTVLVKLVASAITIGSGGSGGREGPTAQISAGFGSLLARTFNLSPADGRIAVSVGIGAGIGAIFKAPLGGAVLAAEILYRDDIEVESMLPGLIASVLAYAIFGAFEGYTPLFGFPSQYRLTSPWDLAWFALIGLVAGLVGLAYADGFYRIAGLFNRIPVIRHLKAAIGALGVGLVAMAVPEVLGTGYGWVQQGLSRHSLLSLPLAVVVFLPFVRIVSTGLSIGSGGSGGIFGPGIVIGAFTGAALWRLLAPVAPGIPHQPTSFVIVAMMACFGSVARAPLAVMLMVAEMTSSLTVLAPAMIAVGIATLVVRRRDVTIYRSQLRTRSDSPAHRLQFGLPLLSNVTVGEVMSPPRLVLQADEALQAAGAEMGAGRLPGAPVVDRGDVFVGTVRADALADAARARPEAALERVVDVTAPSVQAAAALDVALEALGQSGDGWITVLDSAQHVVGIFDSGNLVAGYRRALAANTARLSRLAGNAVPIELEVAAGAPVAGKAIRDAALPSGTIVVTISRDAALVFGDAQTVLEPGDLVSALVRPESEAALRDALGAGEGVP